MRTIRKTTYTSEKLGISREAFLLSLERAKKEAMERKLDKILLSHELLATEFKALENNAPPFEVLLLLMGVSAFSGFLGLSFMLGVLSIALQLHWLVSLFGFLAGLFTAGTILIRIHEHYEVKEGDVEQILGLCRDSSRTSAGHSPRVAYYSAKEPAERSSF